MTGRGCHDCEISEQISRGLYKDAAWDEVPCSTCKVAEKTSFSLEFDEGRLAGGLNKIAAPAPELNDRTLMPIEVMRECVIGLLTLPPELRDVVAWRFAGLSYQDIADVQGVSMAAAEKRHRRAIQLWPGLEAMFRNKTTKKKRRKAHAKHK